MPERLDLLDRVLEYFEQVLTARVGADCEIKLCLASGYSICSISSSLTSSSATSNSESLGMTSIMGGWISSVAFSSVASFASLNLCLASAATALLSSAANAAYFLSSSSAALTIASANFSFSFAMSSTSCFAFFSSLSIAN